MDDKFIKWTVYCFTRKDVSATLPTSISKQFTAHFIFNYMFIYTIDKWHNGWVQCTTSLKNYK